MMADKNYCWDGTACTTGLCSATGEALTGGLPYNCPGSGMYESSGNPGIYNASSAVNKSVVDGLSGYNNPATGLHKIVCSGTLLGGGNITLAAGDRMTFPFQKGWQGAFYPRTGCSFDPITGIGDCETGKCIDNLGNSVIGCGGAGSENPVTKGELNLDDNGDWFDVSFVNGFNVGMTIEPGSVNAGSDNCHAAGCAIGLPDFRSLAVPDFSALKYIVNGKFVGIWSDCDLSTVKGTDPAAITKGYCCPYPPYINSTLDNCGTGPGTCNVCAGQDSSLYPFNQAGALPNSAKLFFDACPGKVYTYAYNDSVPNRQCHNTTGQISSYLITFYRPNPALLGTMSPGGSDSDQSSPSSGSGSTVASAPGAGPGEELSFSFGQAPSLTSPVAVSHISLAPSGSVESFTLLAKPVVLGSALQLQDRPVAGYLEISPIGANPSSVDFHIIRFSVAGSWLTANTIAPGNIVLARYHDNQWNDLPTTPAGMAGADYLFDASTPGFSYFAVTVNQSGKTPAGATSLQASASTVTALDTVGAAANAAMGTPATRDVAPGQTPVSAVPPAQSPPVSPSSSPFSAVTVALALAGVLVAAGCAMLVRRWWIRRQNPALFREM